MNETPAFPCEADNSTDTVRIWNKGMMLRDYFAAKALAGVIIAHPDWGKDKGVDKRLAQIAYRLADAMLAERGKTK